MRIASAAVQMDASHTKQQSHEIKVSVRSLTVNRTVVDSDSDGSQAGPTVVLSESGKAMQSGETAAIQKSIDETENDPKLRLIRSLVAMLTGKEIKSLTASAQKLDASAVAVQTSSAANAQATPPQAASPSSATVVEYSRRESYSESEQTSFSAAGVINTADGKQIGFSLSLSMSRSYYEASSTTVTIGDTRQLQDPLVLNFDGEAAQLTDQRFAFDLDSDGDKESINFVAGGSGFLALDRNGDGQINDGSELFGANSGNGFGELAALDDDHNGWIDENDAAFTQLKVWTKDGNGSDQLSTLKDASVGAIGLDHVATSFDIKNANNELQGRIRSSGVFLQEDGKVGSVQQIDLTI
jgi:ribosomal protein L12E/L44/L45/RPP1/RPP2